MKKKTDNDLIKIVFHEYYSRNYITSSCEIPDRVASIIDTLKNHYEIIKSIPCTEDDILLCHSEGLLQSEKQDPFRYETACLSAGGAIQAASMALEGYIPFAAIRPPGHHANPDHNWGFCFFNNMAIAIKKLIQEKRIKDAIILDIDLHFGDGTDAIFKDNANVKVINIQSNTSSEFIYETKEELSRAGSADIIGISAGFDQYVYDWGGTLTTEDYNTLGFIAGTHAAKFCHGHIFAILEGGYYVPHLGTNAHAFIQGIAEGLQ